MDYFINTYYFEDSGAIYVSSQKNGGEKRKEINKIRLGNYYIWFWSRTTNLEVDNTTASS